MAVKLKKVDEQVVVITGASSGIGLATARLAAKRGAKLVLAARSGDALNMLAAEVTGAGGEAVSVVCDVGQEDQVRALAQRAVDAFGRVDTWVNNAGISTFGELTTVPTADMRRLFETNYWGTVYGSLAAVERMREAGGALVNVGSTLSDAVVPLQVTYCASKHALKAFTDGLRMELEHAGAPISVTLVKPGPIDTPYTRHAKNYLEHEPKHATPPVYAPETVARAILHAAESPQRDIFVGSGSKSLSVLNKLAPRLADKLLPAVFYPGTESDRPAAPLDHNGLDGPMGELDERGNYPGTVRPVSVYTEATTHPAATGTVLGAAATALAARRLSKNGG